MHWKYKSDIGVIDTVIVEDHMWVLVSSSNGLMCVDLKSNKIVKWRTFPKLSPYGERLFFQMYLNAEELICIPYNSESIVVYNLVNDEFKIIDSSITNDINMKFFASVRIGELIYVFPWRERVILQYNIDKHECNMLDEWYAVIDSEQKYADESEKFLSIRKMGNIIIAPCYLGNTVYICDVCANMIKSYTLNYGDEKVIGVEIIDNLIYVMPLCMNRIYIYSFEFELMGVQKFDNDYVLGEYLLTAYCSGYIYIHDIEYGRIFSYDIKNNHFQRVDYDGYSDITEAQEKELFFRMKTSDDGNVLAYSDKGVGMVCIQNNTIVSNITLRFKYKQDKMKYFMHCYGDFIEDVTCENYYVNIEDFVDNLDVISQNIFPKVHKNKSIFGVLLEE